MMVGSYPPVSPKSEQQDGEAATPAHDHSAAQNEATEQEEVPTPAPEDEGTEETETETADAEPSEEANDDSERGDKEKKKKKKENRPGIPVTSELVRDKCARCHETNDEGHLSRISYMRKNPEGWELSLKRMVRLNAVEVTPEEAKEIVRYLSNDHGLARAEAEASLYEIERRVHWSEEEYDQELRESCGECHTLGRVLAQRRDAKEWKLLKATHLAFFPVAQRQAFTGRRRGNENVDWESLSQDEARSRWERMQNRRGPDQADRVLEQLAKTQSLFTDEWKSWQVNRREVPVEGRWAIIGHEISRGDVRGEVQITRTAEAEYETEWRLHYGDGRIVVRRGKGLLYAGYSWRGRSTTTAPKEQETLREAMVLSEDWKRMRGRIFAGEYHELGIDVELVRYSEATQILAVDDAALMIPSEERWVTITGANFPDELETTDFHLGQGVEITEVDRDSDEVVKLKLNVDREAEQGTRYLSFRAQRGSVEFTLYDTIDYIRISPGQGLARVGGSFRPGQMERFEAIAMNRGRDDKPYTDDDFEVRVVDASWSLEEFPVRENDDDVQFVGQIDADTGVFTPAADGPNPERRWKANNIGDVYVVAVCTLNVQKVEKPKDDEDGEDDAEKEESSESEPAPIVMEDREFRARGHLIVTVPIYVNWNKYEWDRR